MIESLTPKPVIQIEGVPEAAEGEDTLLYIGTNYTFSGEGSQAPAGNIKKYEWDFGDGSAKKTTRIANYVYEIVGTYEVSLTITDETGRTGKIAKRVLVKPPAKSPVPNVLTDPEAVDGKISATVPVTVIFNASESTDPDNDIVDFRFDFENDGTVDSHEQKVTHTYETVGTFETTLVLVDGDNNETKWSVAIEVKSPGLQAKLTASPTDGEVPLTVRFDASGSSYAEGNIVAYEWNFGDGSEERIDVAKISHQYTRIGNFEAKVRVVGEDDAKQETTIQIHVRSISLKACFIPSPEQGSAPLEVLFDPGCSTGTVSKYKWTFGTFAESRERKPTFTFTQPGAYEVTLEVMDNANVTNVISKAVTVE